MSNNIRPGHKRPRQRKWRAVLDMPEVNLAIFAFLLHFAWEMLQGGLFQELREAPHWEAVSRCTRATLGDVGITLAVFWGVAGCSGGRQWPQRPRLAQVLGFTGGGLLVTIASERLATQVWDRWSYHALMPVVPLLDVGLTPLLQWTLLPSLIVWFVYRQLT